MLQLDKYKELANKKDVENFRFLKRLKAKVPRNLDVVVKKLHEDVFSKISCLDCANCCKSLGPRITVKDIERISKQLKIKPDTFIDQYLMIDEDHDYIFKSMPCPFLEHDNYCRIYDQRPKACSGYPHTDSRDFHKRLTLTYNNTFTCPAVYEIVEKLREFF